MINGGLPLFDAIHPRLWTGIPHPQSMNVYRLELLGVLFLHQFHGVAGDDDFLVGGHHPYLHL